MIKIEMNVEVDASLLKYDTDTLYKNVQKELRASIIDANRMAKEVAPVRTGALRNSIHYGGSRLTWWSKTTLDYALYTEDGAGPHTIEGNPFLMSEAGHPNPLEYPRAWVNHPGTPAFKYMETALYMSTEDLEERILRALIG